MGIAANRQPGVLRSFAELRRARNTKIASAVGSPGEMVVAFERQYVVKYDDDMQTLSKSTDRAYGRRQTRLKNGKMPSG
jgi:hypothetical protein